MFWLEEELGDLPRDGESSSCSSPLQERPREESKKTLTGQNSLGREVRVEEGVGSACNTGENGKTAVLVKRRSQTEHTLKPQPSTKRTLLPLTNR